MGTSRRIAFGIGTATAVVASVLAISSADALRPSRSVSGCPTGSSVGDADIVYLGHYESGGAELPYSFRGGGNRTGVTKVVGTPARKTFFVVSSYEPTVWDFSMMDPSKIAGVHASGFYEQGVAGVPSSSPVTLRHRSANNGADPTALADGCLGIQYLYKADDAPTIASVISSALGKMPRTALMSYASNTFDLSFQGMPTQPVMERPEPSASSVVSENPINDKGLQPGDAGLRQMVRSGVLVPIRGEILAQWMNSGMLAGEGTMAGNPNRGTLYGGMTSYVVTRSVDKLPDGLFGAHLVTFILPPGVSAPVGMATHSSFLRYVGPAFPWAGRSYADPNARIGLQAQIRTGYTPQQSLTRVDWSDSNSMRVVSYPEQGPQYRPTYSGPPMPQVAQSTTYRTQDPFVSTETGTEDQSWIEATLKVLGMLTIALIALWQRRRIMEAWAGLRDLKDGLSRKDHRHDPNARVAEAATSQSQADGPDRSHAPSSATVPEPVADKRPRQGETGHRVMRLTSEVVDATEDDATIAEVSRLRRDLTAAMSRSWDGDIASELESLVKHCSVAAAEYLVVRARTTTPASAAMEASLLEATRSIRGKLRELAEQQGRRDAGSIATQEGFIRRRHGPDDLSSLS